MSRLSDLPVTRLSEIRRAKLVTQASLAAKAGVTVATISHLETGRPARVSTVKKIAKALGVKPDALLTPIGIGS